MKYMWLLRPAGYICLAVGIILTLVLHQGHMFQYPLGLIIGVLLLILANIIFAVTNKLEKHSEDD
jgi:O-antigen/teichoic acid export membrane protein